MSAEGVDGLWFMVEIAGQHRYGVSGTYEKSPEKAYIPACKALYGLSSMIENEIA